MAKLNATQVRNLKEPGRYSDGNGLLLNVKPSGSKSWMLRLQADGRRRDYGLGSVADVSLAEAREQAAEYRKMLRRGVDPLAIRDGAQERVPTFRDVAAMVHGEHKRGWKNGKHQAQWLSTLESYAFPVLGDLQVDAVEGRQVRDVLADIWLEKPETARRVRQRIGAVLDYAFAKGWREHETPMRSVAKGLPRQPRKTGRFEAMPYAEVPAFLAALRSRVSMGRLALEALILTAARSGEVRGARWSELDLEAATWTVPAERMKAGKVHAVPLSAAALDVFRRAAAVKLEGAELVFPGQKHGKPLSDMTLMKVLRDAKLPYTAHGFRSAFRDWVAEQTSVPGEVAEAALAHAIPNRVEAAYRRTDFLEKRRKLMESWGLYCEASHAAVVQLAVA
jgi:integrase